MFCLRFLLAISLFISSSLSGVANAQEDAAIRLNGVLYEVVPATDTSPKQAFLWSLELQVLSTNYDWVVESTQRKKINVLFFSEMSGRDWRRHWSERMRLVYQSNAEMVNDQAEAFFQITDGFPETFQSGDQFSILAEDDGATRAYLNNKLVAQSLKPGHFEFWLRGWNTGLIMPDQFRGNLLAGGVVSEDLLVSYRRSEPPMPPSNVVRDDDYGQLDTEATGTPNVVPVVLK